MTMVGGLVEYGSRFYAEHSTYSLINDDIQNAYQFLLNKRAELDGNLSVVSKNL